VLASHGGHTTTQTSLTMPAVGVVSPVRVVFVLGSTVSLKIRWFWIQRPERPKSPEAVV